MVKKPVITTKTVEVTPKLAKEYLKKNTDKNRKLRTCEVNKLVRAIKQGEWLLTHNGIAFDTNGELCDGQHRLHAVIQANATVPMRVTYNVDPDTYHVIDQGAKRSTADIFGLPQNVADTINIIARFILSRNRPSAYELESIVDAFAETAEELVAYCGRNNKFFSSAPIKAAAVATMMLYPENKQHVLDMYWKFNSYFNANLSDAEEEFINASPIVKAAIRHVNNNSLATGVINKPEQFAKGMVLFNAKNEKLKRITSLDPISCIDELREFYKKNYINKD